MMAASALAYFLGPVLALSGLLKLVELELTRTSLGRLAAGRVPPALLTAGAVVLGGGEIVLGLALLVPVHGVATAIAAAVLCTGFCLVVRRARRLGAACGCFGSFSVRTAGRAEWVRALGLAAASLLLLALRLLALRLTGLPLVELRLIGSADGVSLPGAAAGLVATVAAAWSVVRSARRDTGWRLTSPWQRHRILRRARAQQPVRDVVRQLDVRLPWRAAVVRVTGRPVRVTSIVVPAGRVRLQVLLPTGGTPVVVGYRPTGVVTPKDAMIGTTSRKLLPQWESEATTSRKL